MIKQSRMFVRRLLAIMFATCAVMLAQAPLLAAPHNGDIFTLHQADGTTLQLKGYGDDFHGVFESMDGYAVIKDNSRGGFCYASLSADGNDLVSTGVLLGKTKPAGLQKHLRLNQAAAERIAIERRAALTFHTDNYQRWNAWKEDVRKNGFTSTPTHTTTGSYIGMTVLVDFKDDEGTITRDKIDKFCNKAGYKEDDNNGSVYDYYRDNSNSLLSYTNIVVGYYRAKKPKSYYNDKDNDPEVLVKEVADYIKANPPTGFEKLTTFPNGHCCAINILYAGDRPDVWGEGLWPHQSSAGPYDLGGGKQLYNYQWTNMGDKVTLATFCHENGHMICDYPDLYDYTSRSSGVGEFCLMSSNSSATNPEQICAYLKYKSGWGNITCVSKADKNCEIYKSGPETDDHFGNQFYLCQKPGAPTEYFLWENRQKSGRDATLPAAGILVWHVDELGDQNNPSLSANSFHRNYECALVQADNKWQLEKGFNSGDGNDAYYKGNTAAGYADGLTDATAPSAKWWDGSSSGLSITLIGEPKDAMFFDVDVTPTYSVSGTVAGSVAGGVTIFLSGAASATTQTDAKGSFVFNSLLAGTYTLTPSYSDATFTPDNTEVIIAKEDKSGIAFASSGGTARSIAVTTPRGSDTWDTCRPHRVDWNAVGLAGDVTIEVLKSGVSQGTIGTRAAYLTFYEWKIPTSFAPDNDYQIKISSADKPLVSAVSGKFSITYTALRATIGSQFPLYDELNAKPGIYIKTKDGKTKTAKVVWSEKKGNSFEWTAKTAVTNTTLYLEPKGEKERVVTDKFSVIPPVIESSTRMEKEKANYKMRIFGVTGDNPKVWWDLGDGRKLTCADSGYNNEYKGSLDTESVEITFNTKKYDKEKPTKLVISNALGQSEFTYETATK